MRRLAALAAVAATAVLADWVVLEAVHRAPGDARIGDFGAGAWLLLLGTLLAAAAAVPVRRQDG